MNLMAAVFENQDNKNFDYYAFSYSNYDNKVSDVSNRASEHLKIFLCLKIILMRKLLN